MLRNLLRIKEVTCLFRANLPQFHDNVSKQLHRTLFTDKSYMVQSDAKETENENKTWNNPFTATSNITEQPSNTQNEKFTNDEEKAKRLQVLQLEADIWQQEGRRVPELSFFTDKHWESILALPSKSARIKYYSYLWQVDMKKKSNEIKKEKKAEATLLRKEEMRKQREECDHIVYGLGHTSMFLRIYDSTICNWQNYRLIKAMQFAPKMVLDCSYDQYMTKHESLNCSKQLMLSFADNRAHDDPYDLHLCNVNLDSICMKGLKRFIPTMLDPEFPLNVHSQCFTNIFPKEKIVYLTPHCRTDLVQYNPDDIYIVGAMVDMSNSDHLSLAKAKRLGLRMARLPLDRYLQWGTGSGKSLTLNQMVKIMLDIKATGDWDKALEHVPRRKIVEWQAEKSRSRLRKHAERMNVKVQSILTHDPQEDDHEPKEYVNPFKKRSET